MATPAHDEVIHKRTTRTRRYAFALALLAGVPCGCDAVLGIQDHPVGGDASTRDSSAHADSSRPHGDSAAHDDTGTQGVDGGGVLCEPAAPAGWAGPYAILEQVRGDAGLPTPLSCPATYGSQPVLDGVGMPDETPADCGCFCRPPTNIACSGDVTIQLFSDTACQHPLGSGAVSSGCTNYPPLAGAMGATVSGPPVTAGNCQAGTEHAPTLVGPEWTSEVRLCSPITPPTAGACKGDRVSMPVAPAPYEAANYCVTKSAPALCPAAYPSTRTYYALAADGGLGLSDSRTCSCNCSEPTGSCTAMLATSKTGGCGGGPAMPSGALPISCTPVGPPFGQSGSISTAMPLDGGASCMPSQVSDGGVTPSSPPLTVCCLN
jgi:hypothetical protein